MPLSATAATARAGAPLPADAARDVLLVRAHETGTPTPLWTDDDARWATRLARSDAPAGAAAFLAARARHALQRLAPREPRIAALRRDKAAARLAPWCFAAAAVGSIAGLGIDRIGSAQQINLLAPPVWGVVAWNAVVFAWLAASWLSGLARKRSFAAWPEAFRGSAGSAGTATHSGAGPVAGSHRFDGPHPLLAALGRRLSGASVERGAAPGSPLQRFGTDWSIVMAPARVARAALVLHIAAAALAIGMVGGLYLRGLVLDYRAGWQSTFLDAATVQRVLDTALAPASRVTGIAVPAVAALRVLPAGAGEAQRSAGEAAAQRAGGAGGAGDAERVAGAGAADHAVGDAAPWIHLYAATLLLFVALPRGALAALAAWRLRSSARAVPLPLHEPYFQRLLLARDGRAPVAWVVVDAGAIDAEAALRLREALAVRFGPEVLLRIAPPAGDAAAGAAATSPPPAAAGTGGPPAAPVTSEPPPAPVTSEPPAAPVTSEPPAAPVSADATIIVAWVDMAATPEADIHGAWLAALEQQPPSSPRTEPLLLLLAIDGSAFRRRFATLPSRIAEREALWRRFAAERGVECLVLPVIDGSGPNAAAAHAAAATAAPSR